MKMLNFQSELHYDFRINKLGNVPLFTQAVLFPGISTNAPETGTPFAPIKHVGDSLRFENLVVTLKLDEGMETWYEMYKWLTGITRSESYQQFVEIIEDTSKSLDGAKKLFKAKELDPSGKGYQNTKSSASLLVMDSQHVPYVEIIFADLHPVSMGGFVFRSDGSDTNYLTYDMSFTYNYFYPRLVV